MSAVLSLRDVAVRYGDRLVLDVPVLDIEDGAHVAIVGPNGAGKSTLLRVLALLERPAAGSVRFRDRPVPSKDRSMLVLRRRMAVVLQAPPLCDTTVEQNVGMGLQFRRVPAADSAGRVRRWMERFGIAHLAGRAARTLSGGEAQRACLARAFVVEPEVLFLDEPFAALDAPTRDTLLGDLEAILRESKTTVVVVTHSRDEAARLADRLVVVAGGRLHGAGTKEEMLRHPPNPECAELFGFVVLGDRGRLVAVPPGGLALGRGRITYEMVVRSVVEMGYERRIIGDVNGARIEVRVPGNGTVPLAGERVAISAREVVEFPGAGRRVVGDILSANRSPT